MQTSAAISWIGAITSAGFAIAVVRPVLVLLMQAIGQRFFASQIAIQFSSWTLSWLPIPQTWRGQWEVTWSVKSGNFDTDNTSTVTVYRAFKRVTASVNGTSGGKPVAAYAFIGEINDSNCLTGIWFDASDRKNGYHGAFQLNMEMSMKSASGKWIGIAQNGKIKAGELSWKKL